MPRICGKKQRFDLFAYNLDGLGAEIQQNSTFRFKNIGSYTRRHLSFGGARNGDYIFTWGYNIQQTTVIQF